MDTLAEISRTMIVMIPIRGYIGSCGHIGEAKVFLEWYIWFDRSLVLLEFDIQFENEVDDCEK